MRGLKYLLLAVGILMGTDAQAGFLYTLHFGEASVVINNVQYNYAATEFSFMTQDYVEPGNPVTVQPPGDLNGFSVTSLSVDITQSVLGLSLYPPDNMPAATGEVIGFYFEALDAVPQAPGTYQTQSAWRWVATRNDTNSFRNATSTGSLTITEVATVPEPTSLALVGFGALLAIGYARRKANWNG